MRKEKISALKFDDDKNEVIRRFHSFKPIDIAEMSVICDFGEAIEKNTLKIPK